MITVHTYTFLRTFFAILSRDCRIFSRFFRCWGLQERLRSSTWVPSSQGSRTTPTAPRDRVTVQPTRQQVRTTVGGSVLRPLIRSTGRGVDSIALCSDPTRPLGTTSTCPTHRLSFAKMGLWCCFTRAAARHNNTWVLPLPTRSMALTDAMPLVQRHQIFLARSV
jgi:hypothetical protein